MFERFSQDARQVVVAAQEQARDLGHNYIGTEHLLLGVLAQPPEVPASRALRALGYSLQDCRGAVAEIIGPIRPSKASRGNIPFTPRCKTVMELSLREAQQRGERHIGAEHIALALVREAEGVAAQILVQGGPSLDAVRKGILTVIDERGPVEPDAVAERVYDRTPATEEVLALAEELAAGAPVGSHHLLEALARTGPSMAGRVLAALGVDPDSVVAQVDGLDPAVTTDVTPQQVAAARTRLWADGDEVRVAVADPELAERIRGLIGDDGALSGGGRLAGPFVELHRGVIAGLDAVRAVLARGDKDAGGPFGVPLRIQRPRP